eukprot:1358559-Amphidinium_carterae.1
MLLLEWTPCKSTPPRTITPSCKHVQSDHAAPQRTPPCAPARGIFWAAIATFTRPKVQTSQNTRRLALALKGTGLAEALQS